MNEAYVYPTPWEKTVSGAFTVAVHILFAAFLVVGLTWQRKYQAEPNIVDLWADLPAAPMVPPPPEPVAPPQPVKLPAPQPAPPPPVAKPDIALREKVEHDKQVEEKRKEEEKKRQQELEAQHVAEEQEKARQAAAAQQQAARQNEIDKYRKAISDKIKRFIILPPNLQGNPEAQFDVRVFPGGEVMTARLSKSSGVPAYDDAVERAIIKAQKLPVPPSESPIFDQFRELNLTFRPQE